MVNRRHLPRAEGLPVTSSCGGGCNSCISDCCDPVSRTKITG
ncbi:hypothetical protein [Paenibacillus sp. sgz500958]